MVFSDIPFLIYFLPVFMVVYFIVPAKLKTTWILFGSLAFYAFSGPKYIALLLISSVIDFCNGRFMEKFDSKPGIRRIFLVISLVLNLGMLAIFKYGMLFLESAKSLVLLAGATPVGILADIPSIVLPVGISFFTFQTMSYSIDVYNRKVKAEHNFIDYMAFVCLFPQLIAGPIVRYKDVMAELNDKDSLKFNFSRYSDGITRFLRGLFKKVLIANQVGSLWDLALMTDVSSRSVLLSIIGVFAFSLQIYFDFSGYSDMAIGLGMIMGFKFPENFDHPYVSKSATEFWRRWHMTLSSWFRDYVYIPLGGNKKGLLRQCFNILIVWALTGFWHGASWNFLLWGLYYADLLILEKVVLFKKFGKAWGSHIYFIVITFFGWLIFAIDDFKVLVSYFGTLFGRGAGIFVISDFYTLRNYALVLILGIICALPVRTRWNKLYNFNRDTKLAARWIRPAFYLICFVVCIACLVNDSYNPFLYFRF